MSIIARHLEALSYAGLPLRDRLNWYVGQFGLTFDQPVSKGRELRNKLFDGKVLPEAIKRLSPEDQEYVATIPVIVSDNWRYGGKGREVVNAAATFMADGSCASITIFRQSMLHSVYGQSLKSVEEFIDWTHRLLLHEIGHVRDRRSDEEMARTDKY